MMCLLIRSPRFVSTRNGINLNHRIDYTFAPVRVHTKRNQFKSIPTYPSQLKLAQVFRLQEDHLRRCILPPRLHRGDPVWYCPDAIRGDSEAQPTLRKD